MTEAIKQLQSESIEILGWVEKLEPEVVKRRVFVSYLRYGAGMKGKIGQSMALGLPVVSTSLAAEGMGLKDGETALIADDPKQFADKVYRAYTDKKIWKKLSKKGKKHIDIQYGPEAIKNKIKSFFNKEGINTI